MYYAQFSHWGYSQRVKGNNQFETGLEFHAQEISNFSSGLTHYSLCPEW
jgi:hypothetical protein